MKKLIYDFAIDAKLIESKIEELEHLLTNFQIDLDDNSKLKEYLDDFYIDVRKAFNNMNLKFRSLNNEIEAIRDLYD